jgi:RNA polymerase sigma-70 factor (ECF subfamily)
MMRAFDMSLVFENIILKIYFAVISQVSFLRTREPANTTDIKDKHPMMDEPFKFDRQSMAVIYNQYFSDVYRYVRYRIADDTVAEDIASDVFVRLLEAVQKRQGPQSNLKGWLFSTASNAVNDRLRRQYRRPIETLAETMPDENANVQAQVDLREQTRSFHQAFAKLTPEQQHVLALRFGLGYSLEETAESLSKNSNTIKGLQFRALASLQRFIAEVSHE